MTVIWHMCEYKKNNYMSEIKPTIFCLDNLDVLVNKEIIERFFKEYFIFVRNVYSIIQHISDDYFENNEINYNELFCFIFCCRKHSWARVREYYTHKNSFVHVSTKELDITDAFDKKQILNKREQYIVDNGDYYGDFRQEVCTLKALISDLDSQESRSHNIYDLFDDDYRQCNITIGDILRDDAIIIEKYLFVKNESKGLSLYGARGVFYKALFEKFKNDGIFSNIGVIEVDSEDPLVSNARLILNYLNYKTYSYTHQAKQKTVSFEKIVSDFDGIINKDDIDHSLIAMFKLGDDSCWNQLIAFTEIHTEKIETCEGLDVFITKAGHEYLNLIATHFEFFNTRVLKSRRVEASLFDSIQIQESESKDFTYNFEETISNVKEIVKNCCEKMTRYYNEYMGKKFENKYKYLHSYYVYGDANVLHGERIIHTHIRYIDQYRLYVLRTLSDVEEKKIINKKLVELIESYIQIGEDNPTVLTDMSIVTLFPGFRRKIKTIRDSEFEDYTTRIDV